MCWEPLDVVEVFLVRPRHNARCKPFIVSLLVDCPNYSALPQPLRAHRPASPLDDSPPPPPPPRLPHDPPQPEEGGEAVEDGRGAVRDARGGHHGQGHGRRGGGGAADSPGAAVARGGAPAGRRHRRRGVPGCGGGRLCHQVQRDGGGELVLVPDAVAASVSAHSLSARRNLAAQATFHAGHDAAAALQNGQLGVAGTLRLVPPVTIPTANLWIPVPAGSRGDRRAPSNGWNPSPPPAGWSTPRLSCGVLLTRARTHTHARARTHTHTHTHTGRRWWWVA
mmetsp:Transcript_36069/g.94844  ORF Transcript_36069/g.94844 Transcript_36069/m.94844 type:complete len:280 (-) Transcript_36069:3-842(-)